MTSELKPCPFCGSGNVRHLDVTVFDTGHLVECRDCGAGLGRLTEAEAIEAWNTRAERTCKPELCTNTHPGTVNDYEMDELHCSECGCWLAFEYEELPNYCPDCGAKVVE